jgi:hypothetical protein
MNPYFKQVIWITLPRRIDRQAQFTKRNRSVLRGIQTRRLLGFDAVNMGMLNDISPGHEKLGQIGCYLSHLMALQVVAEFGVDTLIMEDDAVLCDGFHGGLDRDMASISPDWELVNLSPGRDGNGEQWGTQAYLVRAASAMKLWRLLSRMPTHIDLAIRKLKSSHSASVHSASTGLVLHLDENKSDTTKR